MTSCPNCSYKLVLLSNRMKYKCALCSRLYSQKYIENMVFREWNKRQKELDIHNLKLSIKPKPRLRLSEEERRLRSREHYRKNRIKYSEYQRNKLRFLLNQGGVTKDYKTKLKHRLNSYRQQQKKLAQLYLKKYNEKVSTSIIFQSPPTFVHSDLLTRGQDF